jgi:transposase
MSRLSGPAGADPPKMKGSTIMTKEPGNVGGVHSHQDTIHVAVNTGLGREVDDREFPTSTAGYRRAVAWLIGHGALQAVGINGSSSYGVGITAAVTAAGIGVIEVYRTSAERRKRHKRPS